MDSGDVCPGGVSARSHPRRVGRGDCLHADAAVKEQPYKVRTLQNKGTRKNQTKDFNKADVLRTYFIK